MQEPAYKELAEYLVRLQRSLVNCWGVHGVGNTTG